MEFTTLLNIPSTKTSAGAGIAAAVAGGGGAPARDVMFGTCACCGVFLFGDETGDPTRGSAKKGEFE